MDRNARLSAIRAAVEAARQERAERLASDERAISRLCSLSDASLARVLGAPLLGSVQS